MQIDLSDKIVFLTGASRGIGKATAQLLGSCGGTLALHCNSNCQAAEALALEIGNNSQVFRANLSNVSSIEDMYNQVLAAYGRVDILINNAGIAINSPVNIETSEWLSSWYQTIQVNLSAAGLLCKLSLADMIKREAGTIINVSSRAAHRGDTSDYLAYAASKGGMEALTKSLARAFGKYNITTFGVAPGFTRTEMAQGFINEYGEEYATSDMALPEMTEPLDIARTIAFLASGHARHATGTTIDINAGSYLR